MIIEECFSVAGVRGAVCPNYVLNSLVSAAEIS
ncbi:Uncharacterised protein [Vibrio cholerae]|nr:Uncharacterised protein [Vibrio cholerae]